MRVLIVDCCEALGRCLVAEILRCRSLPPAGPGQMAGPLPAGNVVLVILPASGGECHAVLLGLPEHSPCTV